ncbi:hypothetical protein [Candidatus Burkholderia verschuerenii]|uniref:hypothetical protein n=1 Tax=Candidatus Burkholderia verschuerenii TaxID=242163 RepID=UPI0012EE08E0|nr:hypothetical protein [Candidatus Burkholderia verschuerenii]
MKSVHVRNDSVFSPERQFDGRARRREEARIAGIVVQFRDGAAMPDATRQRQSRPSTAPRSIVLKSMLKIAVANAVPVRRAQ